MPWRGWIQVSLLLAFTISAGKEVSTSGSVMLRQSLKSVFPVVKWLPRSEEAIPGSWVHIVLGLVQWGYSRLVLDVLPKPRENAISWCSGRVDVLLFIQSRSFFPSFLVQRTETSTAYLATFLQYVIAASGRVFVKIVGANADQQFCNADKYVFPGLMGLV